MTFSHEPMPHKSIDSRDNLVKRILQIRIFLVANIFNLRGQLSACLQEDWDTCLFLFPRECSLGNWRETDHRLVALVRIPYTKWRRQWLYCFIGLLNFFNQFSYSFSVFIHSYLNLFIMCWWKHLTWIYNFSKAKSLPPLTKFL